MVVRSAPNLYLMRINRVSGRRLCMSRGCTFKNEVFKDRRVRTGLTQDEFAKTIGMSKSQISRIETGGHTPYMRTIGLLAQAVGVDRDVLVEYDADRRINSENAEKIGEAQRDWDRRVAEEGGTYELDDGGT